MAVKITEPLTYESLDRDLGEREYSKMRGVQTTASRQPDGSIAVRYHATNVLTFHPDGRIIARTGGWHTATTKERLNRQHTAAVSQVKHRWFVYPRRTDGPGWDFDRPVEFEEGMDLAAVI